MSAVQEAEEEVVEMHGQYFSHRDAMDKSLIPLYQMTNEIDYDVDGGWGLDYCCFFCCDEHSEAEIGLSVDRYFTRYFHLFV